MGLRVRVVTPRRAVALALAGGLLAALTGCGRPSEAPPGAAKTPGGPLAAGVLAEVNGAQLTEADLQRLVPPEFREGMTGEEIRDIIDRWVRTELLYGKAKQDGLENDPEMATRLRDLQRDMLADELLQRELSSRVRVTSDELQAYYRAHQAEYTQEVQLKQIVLDTREDAEAVLVQLKAGASFEELARQRSTNETGARGGDLGFLGKGAMHPAFESVVFDLRPGEYAGPIATTEGFHVLKVALKRPASDPISFEGARDEIMHNLLLQKQQAAQVQLLSELRGAAQVQIASSYAGMSLAPRAGESPGSRP